MFAFTRKASDWIDEADDLPFNYEYRAIALNSDMPDTAKILATTTDNKLVTLLPLGNVTVICYVQDKFGAAANNSISVLVNDVPIDLGNAMDSFGDAGGSQDPGRFALASSYSL